MAHEEFESLAALVAIGAASPEEESSLSEHIRACADCRRALREFEEAAVIMAESLEPISPPADVRATVMSEHVEDVDEQRRFLGNIWWLATAATLFLALWGWREIAIRVSRERVSSQGAEIARLTDQNRRLMQQRDRLAAEMAALAAPGTQTIALTGQEVAPSASARVYLEPEKRRAVVFFTNLPPNSVDRSYQLWIIRSDQPQPQSVGVFDVENGTAAVTLDNLPVSTAIKGLAVTLERRGGSPQPTSAKYYVLGTT